MCSSVLARRGFLSNPPVCRNPTNVNLRRRAAAVISPYAKD
jgi:hypothetical protein